MNEYNGKWTVVGVGNAPIGGVHDTEESAKQWRDANYPAGEVVSYDKFFESDKISTKTNDDSFASQWTVVGVGNLPIGGKHSTEESAKQWRDTNYPHGEVVTWAKWMESRKADTDYTDEPQSLKDIMNEDTIKSFMVGGSDISELDQGIATGYMINRLSQPDGFKNVLIETAELNDMSIDELITKMVDKGIESNNDKLNELATSKHMSIDEVKEKTKQEFYKELGLPYPENQTLQFDIFDDDTFGKSRMSEKYIYDEVVRSVMSDNYVHKLARENNMTVDEVNNILQEPESSDSSNHIGCKSQDNSVLSHNTFLSKFKKLMPVQSVLDDKQSKIRNAYNNYMNGYDKYKAQVDAGATHSHRYYAADIHRANSEVKSYLEAREAIHDMKGNISNAAYNELNNSLIDSNSTIADTIGKYHPQSSENSKKHMAAIEKIEQIKQNSKKISESNIKPSRGDEFKNLFNSDSDTMELE